MATMGSNLDLVKIIKKGDVLTVIETYSVQDYTGQGYDPDKQGGLYTIGNASVFNIKNIQVSIKENKVFIKGIGGTMHSFDFSLIDAEGVEGDDILTFAQNLMT